MNAFGRKVGPAPFNQSYHSVGIDASIAEIFPQKIIKSGYEKARIRTFFPDLPVSFFNDFLVS